MARYAQTTTVDSARTEQELKALLRQHGATGIAIAEHSSYGGAADRVLCAFELHGRHIRFDLRLPRSDDHRYAHDRGSYRYQERPQHLRRKAWEQDVRQRWRSLLLRVKARLEELADLAEQEGGPTRADMVALTTEVFAAQVLLPDGRTLGVWAAPQIEHAYRSGAVPPLLPAAGDVPALPAPRDTEDDPAS